MTAPSGPDGPGGADGGSVSGDAAAADPLPRPGRTPDEVLRLLLDGNRRFAAEHMSHPAQTSDDRVRLAAAQEPLAVVLGCSDSRVAAEIVFDQGLGDLFVVRTAGHVLDDAVLGSIEYGTSVLGAPLVVVLGHHSCGALAAARDRLTGAAPAPGHIGTLVDRVVASLAPATDLPDERSLLLMHLKRTVSMLLDASPVVAGLVDEGRCAVVALEYWLAEGDVRYVTHQGRLDPPLP